MRAYCPSANFTTIKHRLATCYVGDKGKRSMRASRHVAAWNEDFLYSLFIQLTHSVDLPEHLVCRQRLDDAKCEGGAANATAGEREANLRRPPA